MKIRPVSFTLAALLLSACILFPASHAGERRRLVSLAPSLTEMVFELGAGDQLVGVSDHCRYPPEASAIAKVGSYQTPNLETLFMLRPDVILALGEHAPLFSRFDELGLAYSVFDHRTLPGLLDSLVRLGVICGTPEKGIADRQLLERAFRAAPNHADGPKMIFIIGRDYGTGSIANAYAVGKDELYDRLIAAIGCRNAYTGDLAYPVLSGEGVAALEPDIIVEAVYAEMGTSLPPQTLRRDWNSLANLPAVQNERVHYIDADYVFVPGMRLILLKRDLEAIVQAVAAVQAEQP